MNAIYQCLAVHLNHGAGDAHFGPNRLYLWDLEGFLNSYGTAVTKHTAKDGETDRYTVDFSKLVHRFTMVLDTPMVGTEGPDGEDKHDSGPLDMPFPGLTTPSLPSTCWSSDEKTIFASTMWGCALKPVQIQLEDAAFNFAEASPVQSNMPRVLSKKEQIAGIRNRKAQPSLAAVKILPFSAPTDVVCLEPSALSATIVEVLRNESGDQTQDIPVLCVSAPNFPDILCISGAFEPAPLNRIDAALKASLTAGDTEAATSKSGLALYPSSHLHLSSFIGIQWSVEKVKHRATESLAVLLCYLPIAFRPTLEMEKNLSIPSFSFLLVQCPLREEGKSTLWLLWFMVALIACPALYVLLVSECSYCTGMLWS